MSKVLIDRELLEGVLDDPRLVVAMKSDQIYGIRDALAQSEALHQVGHALGLPAGSDLTRDLLPVVEALREKADKYAIIERIMQMLECDEREGGIWAACSLLLISGARKMNSAKSVVEQECVTALGEELGNWRVTVERIDAAHRAEAEALRKDKERLDSGCIMMWQRDEWGERECEHRGVDLRARIDDAMAAKEGA